MRIILSGGGTGGHIYPAIAIAKELVKLAQPCDILFVGTKHGLEADIIPKEGFNLETIQVHGLERRFSWESVKTIWSTMGSLWDCRRIIRQFKPDVVIGTGGYVCGPIVLTAALMGTPTLIQEQNAIPGITNKLLALVVDKIALGYKEAIPFFSNQKKIVVTGNPIREEVVSVDRAQGIQALGLDEGKKTVLVAGGSRGARSINRAMKTVHQRFANRAGIQILHVTGQSEYNNMVSFYQESGIDVLGTGNIIITPYLYNMPDALAAADIGIFRAGAIGLAELTAKGVPSILVPYPYAAENHQEYNARVLEKDGAAIMITDAQLDGSLLADVLEKLLGRAETLEKMSLASRRLGRPDAAKAVAKLALALVHH